MECILRENLRPTLITLLPPPLLRLLRIVGFAISTRTMASRPLLGASSRRRTSEGGDQDQASRAIRLRPSNATCVPVVTLAYSPRCRLAPALRYKIVSRIPL
ncbi:hypothetical protein AC1031_011095 [Aphanomyces cochlioides]|nr:hypothetical protein AC1031_011095 [Aphanomyces cochlioides]